MKQHHRFTFFCTLLLPIGAIIGAGIGSATGFEALAIVLGSATGICASYILMKSSESAERS